MKYFTYFQSSLSQTQLIVATLLLVLLTLLPNDSFNVDAAPTKNHPDETELHFGFKTENGQIRSEDIKFNNTLPVDDGDFGANGVTAAEKKDEKVKPVEYRGGYSFISADGYKYTVVYKAGKKGFQPYVTAHKISKTE